MNRSTVREALRNLQSAGLLTRRDGGKRLYVSRPTVEAVGGGVSAALALHDASFADVWQALLAVQPAIAAATARHASAPHLQSLEAIAAGVAATGQPADEAVRRVVTFFRALGEACGNPVFVLLNEPLLRLLEPSLAIMIDEVPQARQRIRTAQRRILEAVRDRDADGAASWMHRHIRDFRRGYELAGIPLATRVG